MGQDVIACSALSSFAPHSQAADKAIPHLRVSERNRPTPIWRRLNLTHAGLGNLIPGGVALTSLINAWSLEAFSRHSMLHLYSTHRATLVPDWAGSFGSSRAAGTNGCFDLSWRRCLPSGDRNFSCRKCSGSWVGELERHYGFLAAKLSWLDAW